MADIIPDTIGGFTFKKALTVALIAAGSVMLLSIVFPTFREILFFGKPLGPPAKTGNGTKVPSVVAP